MKGNWHLLTIGALVGFYASRVNALHAYGVALIWLVAMFQTKRIKRGHICVILVVCIFFSYYYFPRLSPLDNIDNQPTITMFGKIDSEVDHKNDRTSFVFLEANTKEKILVTSFHNDYDGDKSPSVPTKWQTGTTCQISGAKTIPPSSNNPGQFNYQQYLAQQKIHYQVTVTEPKNIVCDDSFSMRGSIYQYRQKIVETIDKKLSSTSAMWMQSLLFGKVDALPDSVVELFRDWNLSHLLAISGLHIGVLGSFLYFSLLRTGIATKTTSHYLIAVLLIFYPFLTGGSPSVWRAVLMMIIGFVCCKQHKLLTIVDLVSVIFLLLLLGNREIIYQIGFQYSFVVTYSLILSRRILSRYKKYFTVVFLVSMISMVSVLPIQISHFYTFQPLALLINVLFVPYFTTFVMPFLFFFFISLYLFPQSFLSLLDSIFVFIQDKMITLLFTVNDFFSAPIIVGELPIFSFLAFYLLFFAMMRSFDQKRYRKALVNTTCLTFLCIFLLVRPYLNPYGTVTMLDIGQADALVIELPYRKAVIIYDVGGTMMNDFQTPSDRVYRQVIKPYLYSRGIRKIDAIFLSHAHHDHIGSVPFLLDDFLVDLVITSEYFAMSKDLSTVFTDNNQTIITATQNDRIIINEHLFTVLSPAFDWQDKNDNSLVLLTEFGSLTWLLTGDITSIVEQNIIKSYPDLIIDVLRVPHHGSQTSTSEPFLGALQPQIALISVGENNRFQHPNAEVLKRLEDRDIPIYRTDVHGAIQYIFQESEQGGTFLPFIP